MATIKELINRIKNTLGHTSSMRRRHVVVFCPSNDYRNVLRDILINHGFNTNYSGGNVLSYPKKTGKVYLDLNRRENSGYLYIIIGKNKKVEKYHRNNGNNLIVYKYISGIEGVYSLNGTLISV